MQVVGLAGQGSREHAIVHRSWRGGVRRDPPICPPMASTTAKVLRRQHLVPRICQHELATGIHEDMVASRLFTDRQPTIETIHSEFSSAIRYLEISPEPLTRDPPSVRNGDP